MASKTEKGDQDLRERLVTCATLKDQDLRKVCLGSLKPPEGDG